MNDSILLIISLLISAGIGAYLGMVFTNLKNKSKQSTLEERLANLQLQLQDSSISYNSELQKIEQRNEIQLNSLKESLLRVEEDREEIRREKEFLSTELTRKIANFENLSLKNQEQKAEVEKL